MEPVAAGRAKHQDGRAMPQPPQRRPRPNSSPETPRRAAPGRRTQRRAAPRASAQPGTPPGVLAAMVVVPTILIGVLFVVFNPFGRNDAVVEETKDPNEEIKLLLERFNKLRTETQAVLKLDRESTQFNTRLRGMVDALDSWMEKYNTVFAPVMDADGRLLQEYSAYSVYKAQAGQMRVDLIRVGGF